VFFRHGTSLLVGRGSALAGHCKVAQVVDSPANQAGALGGAGICCTQMLTAELQKSGHQELSQNRGSL
jgi:hypothetical protein